MRVSFPELRRYLFTRSEIHPQKHRDLHAGSCPPTSGGALGGSGLEAPAAQHGGRGAQLGFRRAPAAGRCCTSPPAGQHGRQPCLPYPPAGRSRVFFPSLVSRGDDLQPPMAATTAVQPCTRRPDAAPTRSPAETSPLARPWPRRLAGPRTCASAATPRRASGPREPPRVGPSSGRRTSRLASHSCELVRLHPRQRGDRASPPSPAVSASACSGDSAIPVCSVRPSP
jgi:hypothetical protein